MPDELLEAVTAQLGIQQGQPQKRHMIVRMGHTSKHRRLAWYHPCEFAAMDAMLRAGCGIPADRQYLLLDSTMSSVAVSSSLPSGETFELVRCAAKL